MKGSLRGGVQLCWKGSLRGKVHASHGGLVVLFVLLIGISLVGAANYQANPLDCPVEYNFVSCTGGERQCGIEGGTAPYCYDMSLLNPSGTSTTSSSNYGIADGGHVLDCEATDGAEPYCDSAGSFLCDRSSACYSDNRITQCNAVWSNETSPTTCLTCISGYNYCDGSYTDADGCEIRTDVTSYPSETNAVYNSSCEASCSGNYLDCNGNLGGAVDGCEILNGGACTIGSLSGTYSGCSGSAGNCVIAKSDFETGTDTAYSTNDSLFWGSQYGTGYLINMTNGTDMMFGVNNSGCVVFPDGTTQCAGASDTNVSGLVPYSGATQNVDLGDENVMTTGGGFFGWLGSLANRVNGLFVTDIDASGNVDVGGYLNVMGDIQTGNDIIQATGGTFEAKVDYIAGSNPMSVSVGDVDNDGYMDLAVANSGSDSVSILINNGNGTFSDEVNYGTGTNPRSVSIGDVNNDGYADIAVSTISWVVSILINNGNGTFAEKVDYDTSSTPYSVSIGDVNNDGYADLVATNFGTNSVSVFINNGNGTFADGVDYATGARPFSVAIGDVDDDGYADLATANRDSNSVSILINNGNGTFAEGVSYTTESEPRSVFMGDLDNDGYMDLAVANSGSDSVSILINNGNGTFSGRVDYDTGDNSYSVFMGDVDNDFYVDIVVTGLDSDSVSVFINNGNGTFSDRVDYDTPGQPRSVFMGDLDNDGYADFVTANSGVNDSVSVFINNVSAQFIVSDGNVNVSGNVSVGGDLDVTGDLNVSGVYYGNGSQLDVNSSTWWGGITGWVSGWFSNVGNELSFNESKLNETIASEGVAVGFNSTYNSTYDAKANYEFGANNFNGSGDIATSGNIETNGNLTVSGGSFSMGNGTTNLMNVNYDEGVEFFSPDGNSMIGLANNDLLIDINGSSTFSLLYNYFQYSLDNTGRLQVNTDYSRINSPDASKKLTINNSGSYVVGDLNVSGVYYGNGSGLTDLEINESNLNVNFSVYTNSSTWWGGITGWVSGWFVNVGDELSFNESRLNETIDAKLVGKADYEFGANSFNGSGNFTTSGNVDLTDGSLYQGVYGSDDGLVLYAPLSETGSTQYDRSPYGNDGAVTGATCNSTNGKYGNGCYFDGDDKIDIVYDASLNPDVFTVSVWVKVDGGAGTYRSPITSRDAPIEKGYTLYASDTNIWEFWMGRSTTWSKIYGPAVVLGEWTLVTATYNGTTQHLYVNGVLANSSTSAYTPNTLYPTRIGAGITEGEGSFYFNGSIDEVKVYSRALSEDEIRTHYLRGSGANGVIVADRFRILNTSGTNVLEVNSTGLVLNEGSFVGNGSGLTDVNAANYEFGANNFNGSGNFTTSGNVGIGTTEPKNKLHIDETSADTETYPLLVSNLATTSAGGTAVGIMFNVRGPVGTDRGKGAIIFNNTGNYGTGDMHFAVDSVVGEGNVQLSDSKMVIKSDGNVGIGTSSPDEVLEVNGVAFVNSEGGGFVVDAAGYKRVGLMKYASIEGLISLASGQDFHIAHSNNTDVTDTNLVLTKRLTVLGDGKVGIGIADPVQRLDVRDGLKTGQGIIATFGSTDTNPIALNIGKIGSATASLRGMFIDASETSVDDDRPLTLQRYGGNVGIGVTDPAGRLEVRSSGASTNAILVSSSLDKDLLWVRQSSDGTGSVHVFDNNENQTVVIGGNDINKGRLNVKSTSTSANVIVAKSSLDRDIFWIRESADSDGSIHMFDKTGTQTVTIQTDDADSYFNGGGNVGIGTSSPQAKLDVNGSVIIDASSGAALTVGRATSDASIVAKTGRLIMDSEGTGNFVALNYYNNDPVILGYGGGVVGIGNADADPAYAMDVLGDTLMTGNVSVVDGNVGIGTTLPQSLLHLKTQDESLTLEGNNAGGSIPIFSIDWQNTDEGASYVAARIVSYNTGAFDDGDLRFYTTQNAVSAEKMRIDEDGNVGIGGSPEVKLHVQQTGEGDTIRIQDSDGTCNQDPDAGTLVISCSSDKKLKKNIKNASSALEEFEYIEVKDYIVRASGENMTGVIAQEINETNPDMVQVVDGELFVEQPNPWKLLKAIQELAARIDALVGGNYTTGIRNKESGIRSGTAVVLVNTTSVRVEFNEEYSGIPVVTVTVVGLPQFFYGVDEVSNGSFKILISEVQERDVVFNWHAFAGEGEEVVNVSVPLNLTVGNVTNETVDLNVSVPEEVDEVVDEESEDVGVPDEVNEIVENNESDVGNESEESVLVNETVVENESVEESVLVDDVLVNESEVEESSEENSSEESVEVVEEEVVVEEVEVVEEGGVEIEVVEEEMEEEVVEEESAPITGAAVGVNSQGNIFTRAFDWVGGLFS